MKHLALLPLMLSLIAAPSALALSVRTISTEQAQGATGSIMTVEVAPGYGLNINLIPTGEVVKKAWIDDPSRIVLSFDGNLCQSSGESECNNEGATVVHLRQINPIAFPNLPRSPGGGTLLTLITESSEGRKIYQFKVVPTKGQPKYTVLSISPEVDPPTQVIPPALPRQSLPIVQAPEPTTDTTNQSQWQAQIPATVSQPNSPPSVVSLPPAVSPTNSSAIRQRATVTPTQNPVTPPPKVVVMPKSAPVPTVTPSVTAKRSNQNALASSSTNNSIEQANALVRGLVVARQKGQINHGTTTWKEVQSVVRLLRRGDTKQKATQEVGISPQLIDQLIIWGQRSTVASS